MVNWKKMVTKIPSKVQIAKNKTYEIVWIDSFENEKVLGETRFDKNQIVIKKQLSPKTTIVTYLHEVIHAVSAEHDVELTENQVLALETSFYYLLKTDNVFKGN